ncbi:glutamate 5-kinase [Kineococcus aurantiacus]|uniref:Glutamate 5-kinase n=1 Tax=Kineococcus aurantiacus TaxID=37633 RepID=A0A7Y9AT69_9ACTN|nr:glutamate 5-kinase [Kineococcus aurantiacus]
MSEPSTLARREDLAAARRVVVKVGSSSLTTAAGGLDTSRLDALVEVLAARRSTGGDVVLVSSGAIAAGLAPLGLPKRPRDLASQQAAASVGQGLLLAEYARAFARSGLTVGQVLLTAEDVVRRTHYGNAQRTLERLLSLGVVPVVNENDTVATHEIRFGDNDRLAALVAHLVRADALVLLSDVDALHTAPPSTPGARRIATVRGPEDLAGVTVGSAGAAGVGTGGMTTKVEAAGIAVSAGVPALVTSAALAGPALAGQDVGTWFSVPASRRARRSSRQLWLAHAAAPAGRLVLDDGAVKAVRGNRSSLLPAGVVGLAGRFRAGDPVDLVDGNGHAVARGLVNYSSEELPEMLGRSTRELARQWGAAYEREVVHRDHLVLLGR